MSDDPQLTAALIGAAAALGVGVVTWLLGQLSSLISYRRTKKDELASSTERSRAVLHGSFAVCNFIADKLDDWDQKKNVADLARLSVAQNYITTLIDRSPHENEVLSVSLFDLGLRLESLMFLIGNLIGELGDFSISQIDQVDSATVELGSAVELLQLLLAPDSAMISEDDLAQIVDNPENLPNSENQPE